MKLSYKFPDRKKEAEAIKYMHPDRVAKLRSEVTNRLQGILDSCDDYFDNLIESECTVCVGSGYAYFDIPPGWGWLSDAGHLLCDDCIKRWADKFGALPTTNREGEIEYEQSISEDSAHWRQADFKFI